MAEPGKETAAATPPPPQETVPQAPAAVAEPSLQPISASQDTKTAAGGAAALDSAQPKTELAHQPPQQAVAVAAVGAPEQTTTKADRQPPVATMPQKVAALPPPAETPEQESAAPAAPTPVSGLEEEKKPTAGEMPPPQKDSGGAVRDPPKPEAGMAEGETKPAALDGKRPEPGQEQVATLPPPAETTAAPAEVEAAKQLAAPAAVQQPPRKQEGGAPEQAQEEKDAAPARPQEGEEKQKPARRRWRWLQAVVSLLFLRPKGGETKPPAPGEMAPLPVDEIMKTSSQEQDGKKPPASGQEEQKPAASLKKFRKVGRLVQCIVALTPKKKKKPETASSGPGREEGGSEAKPEQKVLPAPVPPVRNWCREEMRLEHILEEAFARLVASEYIKELHGVKQKCLLTFSVFDLASEVKKQAMIYWWVAEFDLRHRSDPPALGGARAPAAGGGGKGADDAGSGSSRDDDDDDAERIFVMLSDHGFLVPMKNWCSKVIHGCQVNPLVHWMLKRQARGDRFAELDDKGSPADLQLNSSILCLTSGNRPMLQKLRMKDEAQAQPQPQGRKKDESRPQSQAGNKSKKATKEPSMQGKSNNVQDQQQPTTKDEAQVGSKSMAAADKAPSQKDQDPTQAKDQLITKDQQQQTTKDEAQVESKSMTASGKAPSQKDEDPTQTKDQLTKDQQQPTMKDEARVGSKPMVGADKAPSQKGEDLITQDKDQLTNGAQNIKPSFEPKNIDEILPQLFEGKRVILNVNAHVYPISRSAFLRLAECLVVLQLGRWNNLDDKTYMEVDGLDSWNAIGLLKNLRYLGLRGLSRLTELPKGIESLKKLLILDMRGCQNLVKVEASDNFIKQQFPTKKSAIAQLKQLTHLDLTECYMLEHIGRGITSLTELQVFKGFVFATGTQENKACRIQDLKKLKKLQKLTISITTDANVAVGEMADLKNLTSLRKLTITWSEIPSILEGDTKKVKDKRNELVRRWTSFQLPKDIVKLDIRCYPKEELKLERHDKLEKLYLRGGDMKGFSTEKSNTIKTLRLRYLKKFTMEWKDIRSELQNIEYVEIVVTNKDAIREKDKSDEVIKNIKDEEEKIIKQMKIPCFTLDGYGVWTKDQKEEDNKNSPAPNKDAMGNNKASGPSKDSSTKDGAITSGK